MVTRKGIEVENKPCAINPDRQQKRLAAKKCTSYSNKKAKSTGYAKPNYQKIKKHDEVLRKAARHTRSIEKRLAACTSYTAMGEIGLYIGFLGSEADMDLQYYGECYAWQNEYPDFSDLGCSSGGSDYHSYDLARDIHQEDMMAQSDFP